MLIPCYETAFEPVAPPAGGLAGAVHAWLVDLDEETDAGRWIPLLDERERARVRRFVFDRDRNAWACSHAALRKILSRYVPLAPDAIRYRTTGNGKPCLAGDPPAVKFNLSHSGGLALVAVSEIEVGADIERMLPDRSYFDVARRFFSPVDQARLRGSKNPVDLFYTLWSAREAVLKAAGTGLYEPSDAIACTEGAYGPDGTRAADGLCSFVVDGAYRGSIYPVGSRQQLQFFRVKSLSQWR